MQGGRPTPRTSEDHHPHPDFAEDALSEVAKASIWAELARITPGLKGVAAKVLTWLTAEALSQGSTAIRASCRDVAAGSGCAKSKTIEATAWLVAMRFIAKREGTATRPAAYILRFADTLKMGGPKKGPPVERFPQNPGDHRGPEKGPPPRDEQPRQQQLIETAPGVLSIDSKVYSSSVDSFDRSEASDFPSPSTRRRKKSAPS